MAINVSHGPPKFWDSDSLHGELCDAVMKHVEAQAEQGWERIVFSLRNRKPYPYTIRVVFPKRPAKRVGPNDEINQIVQLMVKLLREPPRTTWKKLNVEYYPEGNSIIDMD